MIKNLLMLIVTRMVDTIHLSTKMITPQSRIHFMIIWDNILQGTSQYVACRRWPSPRRRQRRTPLRLREDPQLLYAETLRRSVDNDIRYRQTPDQQKTYKEILGVPILHVPKYYVQSFVIIRQHLCESLNALRKEDICDCQIIVIDDSLMTST